jgi:serine/threonine protein kinase
MSERWNPGDFIGRTIDGFTIAKQIMPGTIHSYIFEVHSKEESWSGKWVLKYIVPKDPARVSAEIELNQRCSRIPHIAAGLQFIECLGSWGMILKWYEGGDLYEWLRTYGEMPEAISVRVMRQLLKCLSHMHEIGVAHLDVKLENILLDHENGEVNAFLGDLGLAAPFGPGPAEFTGMVGTPGYMAPELYEQATFSERVDMWALGVTLYRLWTLQKPFTLEPTGLRGKYRLRGYDESILTKMGISRQGRDFLDKLLKRNPDERMTAKEALDHPWIHSPFRELKVDITNNVADLALKSANDPI